MTRAGIALAALWIAAGCRPAGGPAASPARSGAPPPAPAPGGAAAEDDEPPPLATTATGDTVTIKLVADPQRQARVTWGRKDFGVAPVEVVRPRGSGPMDLLVTAPGALPLHTRVYTDHDETFPLRLYTDADAADLLGYRRSFSLPSSTGFTHNARKF